MKAGHCDSEVPLAQSPILGTTENSDSAPGLMGHALGRERGRGQSYAGDCFCPQLHFKASGTNS